MELQALSEAVKSKDFPVVFPGHWINGAWVNDRRAEAIEPSKNPCDGSIITKPSLSGHIIKQAVDTAYKCFPLALELSMQHRLVILDKFRQICADYEELIERALCVELGKPMWEVRYEIEAAHRAIESVLSNADSFEKSLGGPFALTSPKATFALKPLGPVMAFIPFSTPFLSFMQAFGSAILSGCPLVVMTSSHAALCSMIFTQIATNVGLPDGYFNSLFGSYKYFAKTLQDRRLKAIVYSGSREHCDSIRRDCVGDYSRELVLYSGGKNAVIVDASANVAVAADLCLKGVIKTAGQLNSSTSQVFVPRQMLSQFNEAIVACLKQVRIDPDLVQWSEDPSIINDQRILGPLYSKKAVDKFLRFQTMAKREASDTLAWGKALDTGKDGFFVTPGLHCFENFDPNSAYQSNVFMCPDLSIYAYDDMNQVAAWANATAAPYIVSLVGTDMQRLTAYSKLLDAPNVLINSPTVDVNLFDAAMGRNIAGGQRFAGLGIVNLLTYPQLVFND